jgi:hypothetical protein
MDGLICVGTTRKRIEKQITDLQEKVEGKKLEVG